MKRGNCLWLSWSAYAQDFLGQSQFQRFYLVIPLIILVIGPLIWVCKICSLKVLCLVLRHMLIHISRIKENIFNNYMNGNVPVKVHFFLTHYGKAALTDNLAIFILCSGVTTLGFHDCQTHWNVFEGHLRSSTLVELNSCCYFLETAREVVECMWPKVQSGTIGFFLSVYLLLFSLLSETIRYLDYAWFRWPQDNLEKLHW